MKKKKPYPKSNPQQQSTQHRHLTSQSIITICTAGEIVKGCDLLPHKCKSPCMSGSIISVPRVSSFRLIELAARNVSRVGELLDVVGKLSDLSDDSRLGEVAQNQLKGLFLQTFNLTKELKSEGSELIYNLLFDYQDNNLENANLSDSDLNG